MAKTSVKVLALPTVIVTKCLTGSNLMEGSLGFTRKSTGHCGREVTAAGGDADVAYTVWKQGDH